MRAKRRSNLTLARAQRLFRIHLQMAAPVGQREQQVPHFLGDRARAAVRPLRLRRDRRAPRPLRPVPRAPWHALRAPAASRSRPRRRACPASRRASVPAAPAAPRDSTVVGAPRSRAASARSCAFCSSHTRTRSSAASVRAGKDVRMAALELVADAARRPRRNRTSRAPRPCARGTPPGTAGHRVHRAGAAGSSRSIASATS